MTDEPSVALLGSRWVAQREPAMVTKPETSAQTSACCHDGITIGRMGRRPMLSTGGSPSSRTPIRLSCFRWRFNERKQALGFLPSLPLTCHESSSSPWLPRTKCLLQMTSSSSR